MNRLYRTAVFLALLAIATGAAIKAQTSGPGEQLKRMEAATSLERDGLPSWHLRVSFDLYDVICQRKLESGTIEEWWTSPHDQRIVVTSPSYNSSQLAVHPDKREAYLVNLLLKQVVHPIPPQSELTGIEVVTKDKEFGNVPLSCSLIVAAGTKPAEYREDWPEFCFQPNTTVLRAHLDQGHFSDVRNRLASFLNTSVALDNELSYSGRTAITGHVDVLETYHPVETHPAQNSPEPGSSAARGGASIPGSVQAGRLLTKMPPSYPDAAKIRRVGGTVVLCGVISKQGLISSLDVVSSPDPSLSDSALQAVKQWTYAPYLLNGTPTEVETTITVNFNLNR